MLSAVSEERITGLFMLVSSHASGHVEPVSKGLPTRLKQLDFTIASLQRILESEGLLFRAFWPSFREERAQMHR